MSSYYQYDSSVESFEEFVANSVNDITKKNNFGFRFKASTLKDLVNPDFENLLFGENKKGDKFEIHIEKINKSQTNYYNFKITKLPRSIKTRFGCELETCFIPACKGVEKSTDFVYGSEEEWTQQVIEHLRNNLIPYFTPAFKKRFRFAYVKGIYMDSGKFLDLSNGNIVSENLAQDDYATLRFEPDGSIKCDSKEGLPCEIVSPILNSISEVKLLYENLVSETCNQSNKTTGFHVNVSAVDEDGKLVELTQGILVNLLYSWLPYEKKYYKSLRGEGSNYASKLEDVINSEERKRKLSSFVKNKNGSEISNYEYFAPYGLNIWNLYNIIQRIKYYSLTHWKRNNVVEFRVFPSKNDINLLLKYTKDAVDLFESSLSKYISDPGFTLVRLQQTYLMYKKEFTFPLPEISGDTIEVQNMMQDLDIEFEFAYKEYKKYLFFDEIIVKSHWYFRNEQVKAVLNYHYLDNYYSYDYLFDTDNYTLSLTNPKEISIERYNELKSKIDYRHFYR